MTVKEEEHMKEGFERILLNEVANGGLDGFLKTVLCKFYKENGIGLEEVDMDEVISSMRTKIIDFFTVK